MGTVNMVKKKEASAIFRRWNRQAVVIDWPRAQREASGMMPKSLPLVIGEW